MPHMPHGEFEEGLYFYDVDNGRFGQRRDDDPAIERNPRLKEGCTVLGERKKPTVE